MSLSKNMNVPKGTLTKPTHVVSKINIRLIMLISMMWPAVILANRRKANEMCKPLGYSRRTENMLPIVSTTIDDG